MTKKLVDDMSGHCRFGSEPHHHRRCHVRWETPSAIVTCECKCHKESVKPVPKGMARKIVAKS